MVTDRATSANPRALEHPQELRELAYQVWAFVASRNAAEVARLLTGDDYGNHSVPVRTVQQWAKDEAWAERASRDVQSIAPDLRHQAFSELLFAGLEGAKYIRQVVSGQTPADKVRTQAAIAAVDRIGFSPVGKGLPAIDAPQSADSKTYTVQELMRLSPDQLMQLEEEARRKR